jgi:predicted MFS family arabinose efflux permease
VPERQRAQGLSLWGAGVLITQAAAPMAAEQVLRVGTFGHVYWAAAGACLAAALVSLLLPKRRPEQAVPTPLLTLLRKPAVAVGLLALLSGSLGFGTIYSFLSSFTEREVLGPVAPFFAAYTVGSLAVRVVGGTWADRGDRRLVIVPSLILSALAIASLCFVRTPWQLVWVGLVYGAGSGFSYPALMAFVVDQAEPGDRARAVALDNWSFTVGMLLAATLVGPAADGFGMRAAFAGVGIVGAVAAVALLALRLPGKVASGGA